ncbi:helix-turn-helix domain-containing protein [Acidithrix sp. C25]|uniref:helix-turn-helix transcriptional regulator n=1 Tax=Acidithrix sp. C25 TaxID=1671482 RepID=UPI00191BA438|nr:helix-turn-helix domain-containing protein [Acidithrix sp. C25]CAG4902673.1 unnamed protein product [Acidithrix sp. C25]
MADTVSELPGGKLALSPVFGPGDELRSRAVALGDPTRYRIFEHLLKSAEPVSVSELTEFTRLNHTGIRHHLEILRRSGLIDEYREPPKGRGRPRLLYEASAEAKRGPTKAYERLSLLLIEAMTTQSSVRTIGRKEGVRLATELAPKYSDPVRVIHEAMIGWEFSVTLVNNRDFAAVVLNKCPLESAVNLAGKTVCGLHIGIIEGILSKLQGLELTDFEIHLPKVAACKIELRRHTESAE